MDRILYQIFKIVLSMLSKYITNMLIIFHYKYVITKLKTELHLRQDTIFNFQQLKQQSYLEPLKNDKNGENVPHLKLLKQYQSIAVLLTMIISKFQEYLIHLFQISHFVNCQKFHTKFLAFKKHQDGSFHILRYGSLIPILNHQKQKTK